MKDLLKEKLKSFLGITELNKKLLKIDQKSYDTKFDQDIISFQILSSLSLKNSFFPITDWSISPTAILHILNDIIIHQRKSIIEFGPGISTLYIARLIKDKKLKTKFFTVESNYEYFNIIQEQLSNENLDTVVNVIYSPLIESQYKFKQHELWYNVETIKKSLAGESSFDLVIVDAPPGSSPYSRYGAVPFIERYLSCNGFKIFLDDTYRQEEKYIIEEWGRLLNLPVFLSKSYGHISFNDQFSSVPFFTK